MQTHTGILRHSIDPRGQSPACLPDQVINNRHRAIVISPIEILILIPIRHDIRAHERIRLSGPLQRTCSGIAQALLLNPCPTTTGLTMIQPRGPRPRKRHLRISATTQGPASMLPGNQGIPHAVQVGMHTVKDDGDVIAPAALGLGVQRLMDVAEEMDHEPQALAAVEPVQAPVRYARRVVCDRAHDAAAAAVARHVDTARRGRRVSRVDEVPPGRVRERRHVSHLVREQRRLADVLPVQQRVAEGVGAAAEVHAREVGDRPVAQAAPC